MLDISWTEFLLIGVVALIVIGPKELPGVLRTLGQYTRKVRGMAADFQSQFQEAMREAEMADLKKQVDDIKNFDPLKDVKNDFANIGKDIESSVQQQPSAAPAATTPLGLAATVEPAPTASPTPDPIDEAPAPVAEFPVAAAANELGDTDATAAGAAPVVPEAAEKAAQPDSTERTG
jgi:sec-independent protein translocase protein TatB